jgi:hypothetical protein
MLEFAYFMDGISFGRIITRTVVRQLIRDGEVIRIIRSGVYAELEHCADVIEEECKASTTPKQILIVLPSILNKDLIVRAREAQRAPEEVLANLTLWQETLGKLAIRLAPRHKLEVRTTLEPHRYHAIFSERKAIFGIPWHSEASLATSSFTVGGDATDVIAKLHNDFDTFFRECKPYHVGDNDRLRKEKAVLEIDDEILLEFGKHVGDVLEELKWIARTFPFVDGTGVTKDRMYEKFGKDKNDWNKRLLDMEDAGLLRRASDRCSRDPRHGRVATRYGMLLARKYKDYHLNTPPEE